MLFKQWRRFMMHRSHFEFFCHLYQENCVPQTEIIWQGYTETRQSFRKPVGAEMLHKPCY